MKLNQIPYYVEFVFLSSNDDCMSTVDNDMLQFIKDESTGEPITSLDIGDTIRFEPKNNRYKVTNISIRHLFDDTNLTKAVFDLEGCTERQGKAKDWLFTVMVKMNLVD